MAEKSFGSNSHVNDTTSLIWRPCQQPRSRHGVIENQPPWMLLKMYRAISSAPKIDKVLEEVQKTPFTSRISGVDMKHVGKLKLQTYDKRQILAVTWKISQSPLDKHAYSKRRKMHFYVNCSSRIWAEPHFNGFLVKVMHYRLLRPLTSLHETLFNIHSPRRFKCRSLEYDPEKGGSLHNYIEQFKAITSCVTMDDVASIEALRNWLWYQCHFCNMLSPNKPTILEDALHHTTIYINIKKSAKSFISITSHLRKNLKSSTTNIDNITMNMRMTWVKKQPHTMLTTCDLLQYHGKSTSHMKSHPIHTATFIEWLGHSTAECKDL